MYLKKKLIKTFFDKLFCVLLLFSLFQIWCFVFVFYLNLVVILFIAVIKTNILIIYYLLLYLSLIGGYLTVKFFNVIKFFFILKSFFLGAYTLFSYFCFRFLFLKHPKIGGTIIQLLYSIDEPFKGMEPFFSQENLSWFYDCCEEWNLWFFTYIHFDVRIGLLEIVELCFNTQLF